MINAYTIMMAVILLLGLLMRGNRAGNWKYVWLSCLLMFCILGLRDISTIGNDSRTSYLWTFRGLANRDLSQMLQEYSFETNSGFFVLMKLIHMLTDGDYQLFVIIISAFIMLVFAHFINRYSPDPMQSFCYYWGLLLYLFMFSAQKQALAMTFVLLAFDAILKRKLIRSRPGFPAGLLAAADEARQTPAADLRRRYPADVCIPRSDSDVYDERL